MGVLSLANGTLLVLTPLSGLASMQLTPYSARGLTQSLDPITGSGGSGDNWLRRDVNGYLRSVADTRFRKYKSTISCKDGESPCLDDAWIGMTCEVSCVCELSYVSGAPQQRTAVSGSPRSQGNIIYYRPLLIMMVASIKLSTAEYPATVEWSVELEEI